jgi:ferritin
MINKNVEKAINEQIVVEGYSSHLYLAMASWCETQGFSGAAKFLYVHVDEERLHMLKFIHYLNDRGGHAWVPAIKAPPKEYKDVFTLFKEIMKHEEYVTSCINNVLEITMKEKDFNTANFLQWFVMEQVEEESLFRGILDKMNLLGKEKAMYFLIDKELEALSITPSTPA